MENVNRTVKIEQGYRFGHLTIQEKTDKRKNGYIIWLCTCDCGNTIELDTRCIQRNTITDCGCITKNHGTKLDLTGQRFDRLVCVQPTDKRNKARAVIWECLCDCGNICYVSSNNLRSGTVKSCGCMKYPIIKDFIGKRFGALTVVEYAGKQEGVHHWKCLCDCGNETITTQTMLQSGKTRSCGCLRAIMMQNNLKLCEGTSVTLLKKKKMKNNTSGYTGISYNKKTGRWIAKITFKGKTYYLGSYMDIQEAVRVRLRGEEMYDDFLEWYHREYEIKDTDEINLNNKEVRFMQVNKNVIHREIAGEHILIPIGETALHYNGVFAITEVGAEIWEMLCGGKDIPEIITLLLVKYDVEPDVLAIDVESFLNMLRENSLLNDDSVPIQK